MRERGLVDLDADVRGARDLVRDAREAAARRIAHAADARARGEHGARERDERRGVALEPGLELEALAHRQDRDPVIADRARHEHAIARPRVGDRQAEARRDDADAGRRDEDLIALAAVDDLRVARDELDARLVARAPHRADDALEVGDREALLEHERRREIQRRRAADGEIVDGAVHGEAPDVASREEDRLHDEGVGRDGDAPAARDDERQRGLILERAEERAAERGQEHLSHEVAREPPAAAVREHDRSGVRARARGHASNAAARRRDHVLLPAREVHEIPEHVEQSLVRLLDAMDAEAPDDEHVVADLGELAAVATREADGEGPELARGAQRADDIGALSARREADHDVAAPREQRERPREREREVVVVADRRDERRVVRERRRGDRRALLERRVRELDGDVRGVARAAPVAEREEAASRVERARHRLGAGGDALGVARRRTPLSASRGALAGHAQRGGAERAHHDAPSPRIARRRAPGTRAYAW